MSNGATQPLIYRGPAQQVCYELTEYGYSAILVPDAVYELPTDFATALLRSNTHFQVAPVSAFQFKSKPFGDSASAPSSEQENQ